MVQVMQNMLRLRLIKELEDNEKNKQKSQVAKKC